MIFIDDHQHVDEIYLAYIGQRFATIGKYNIDDIKISVFFSKALHLILTRFSANQASFGERTAV